MKRILRIVFFLLLLVALSGCRNSHNANRQLAEDFAVDRVTGWTFTTHIVERSIYDEETGNFTVYVRPLAGDGATRRVVVRITAGGGITLINRDEVFSVD